MQSDITVLWVCASLPPGARKGIRRWSLFIGADRWRLWPPGGGVVQRLTHMFFWECVSLESRVQILKGAVQPKILGFTHLPRCRWMTWMTWVWRHVIFFVCCFLAFEYMAATGWNGIGWNSFPMWTSRRILWIRKCHQSQILVKLRL